MTQDNSLRLLTDPRSPAVGKRGIVNNWSRCGDVSLQANMAGPGDFNRFVTGPPQLGGG